MKLDKLDFNAFLWPSLILALSLSLAIAAVYYTHTLKVLQYRHFTQVEKARANASSRLQKADEEIKQILQYKNDYEKLRQKGFIGGEQRINWLDMLRQANQQLGLFGIQYQIEPQQPYSGKLNLNLGGYQLQQSTMKLEFGLLHEEDLMRFINQVSAQEAGIFVLDKCALSRNQATETPSVQQNIKAQCELLWLSLKTS